MSKKNKMQKPKRKQKLYARVKRGLRKRVEKATRGIGEPGKHG